MTNPDTSGMLRFLTDELQDAEDAGDRGTSINTIIQYILLINETSYSSLDHGSCFVWMGWFESTT